MSGEVVGDENRLQYEALSRLLYSWKRPEVKPILHNSVQAYIAQVDIGPVYGNHHRGGGQGVQQQKVDYSGLYTVLKDPECEKDRQTYTDLINLLACAIKSFGRTQRPDAQSIATCVKVVNQVVLFRYYEAWLSATVALLRLLRDTELSVHCVDTVPSIINILRADFDVAVSPEVLVVGCSCMQQLSTNTLGREAILEFDGTTVLVSLLHHDEPSVVTRALGALHELSSDLKCCTAMANAGGVGAVMALLDLRPTAEVTRAAAGILQNLSRDKDSVWVVRESGALNCLTPLLLEDDADVQCAAVGALLNLHDGDEESRATLKRLLSLTIAEGLLSTVAIPRLDDDDRKSEDEDIAVE